eukprot:GEMP01007704.1.p1 GENE.GEMP01007704.1~~GEMP01007704.1.p1  ORF type:complete len:353 (+),score=63.58 GEMP01007704.1:111-1169(+)
MPDSTPQPMVACRDSTIMRDVSIRESVASGVMPMRETLIMQDASTENEQHALPSANASQLGGGAPNVPRPYLSIQVGDEDHVDHHGNAVASAQPSTGSMNLPDSNRSSQTQARNWLFSSPTSCRSNASRASQIEFAQADQTIILLDWDDTLCPSTYMMKTHKLGVFEPIPPTLREELKQLEDMVITIITEALTYGCVVIVTNAEEGWIELSAKAWLPQVLLPLRQCKVVSARSKWEPQGIVSPAGWKTKTFYEEIDIFYSRYKHQSWKNVISVGDAPHEREALFRVTNDVDAAESVRRRKCRTKAIKFMIRPTVTQLVHELEMLRKCLKQVVMHDDNLDLQFDESSLPPANQ